MGYRLLPLRVVLSVGYACECRRDHTPTPSPCVSHWEPFMPILGYNPEAY